MKTSRWLLLTHQLPAHPSNVRVRVWRKLKALGAVPIKNSIYALPNQAETREDFEWLRKEILQFNGEASVFVADSITEAENRDIIAAFRKARDEDFAELANAAAALAQTVRNNLEGGRPSEETFARLQKQWLALKAEWERLRKIDFFASPERGRAGAVVLKVQKLIAQADTLRRQAAPEPPPPISAAELQGRVWVTRPSPHIDRLVSAWLIRRYVDPSARFKFAAEPYAPRRGELRFDMSDAEFTHFGDWCTFETLIRRLKLTDQALRELAEIIHDIDLKDGKFGRREASGVAMAVQGLCRLHKKDADRLEAGIAFFDAVHAGLAQEESNRG
ncbi:MAG: chromate resistance protein [Elusimicrobia bacterium]|nr:chromate resistance protein [Elusimicrobiota bacterium]